MRREPFLPMLPPGIVQVDEPKDNHDGIQKDPACSAIVFLLRMYLIRPECWKNFSQL
jgi:hypothetical protein